MSANKINVLDVDTGHGIVKINHFSAYTGDHKVSSIMIDLVKEDEEKLVADNVLGDHLTICDVNSSKKDVVKMQNINWDSIDKVNEKAISRHHPFIIEALEVQR